MTGAHGLLGTDVRRTLSDHGIAHTSVGRDDVALTDPEAVARAVAGHDVVVNCAAWTAVDLAESHQEQATEINTRAAGVVARAAYEQGARIVQMSTNYVFDGEARTPYAEDAPLSPRTTYGRTKAAGERAVREAAPGRHLILRTGWLYGAHGSCFARTVTRIAREHGIVDVVDDQYGQPTWTRDVADLMVRLVGRDAPVGTWHATAGGQTTWYGFAREVVASAGLATDVVRPTHSSTFQRDAVRPAYSVLRHDRLTQHGIAPIGHWQERWAVAAPDVLSDEGPD